uniref:Uncharacterized protein n=1 Tax=Maylandia zebra TaxID=106582 RepID=A0A3P9BEK0_9CICH
MFITSNKAAVFEILSPQVLHLDPHLRLPAPRALTERRWCGSPEPPADEEGCWTGSSGPPAETGDKGRSGPLDPPAETGNKDRSGPSDPPAETRDEGWSGPSDPPAETRDEGWTGPLDPPAEAITKPAAVLKQWKKNTNFVQKPLMFNCFGVFFYGAYMVSLLAGSSA